MHPCHSRSPHQVHRERTKRTSRDKRTTAGIKASSTSGLLWLWLLHVEGGHGAIKKETVWLIDGMVDDGLLGESGKLLLTNDGSKKASFL